MNGSAPADREIADENAQVTDDPVEPAGRRWLQASRLGPLLLVALMLASGIGAAIMVTPPPDENALARPADSDLVIAGGAPLNWDPATASDATSSQLLSQVYEGLTALDAEDIVRPALARSWTFEDGGRTVVFELRPDLTFSDGRPLSAEDVRRSWLRVLDPAGGSSFASLLYDVEGAAAYDRGEGRSEDVAIDAEGQRLTVRFVRPATYFPAVAAVPTLSVVPETIDEQLRGPIDGTSFVSSGAYRPAQQTAAEIRLLANPSFWAGAPAIERITLLTDDGGRSSVDVFEDEAVDWTRISPSDAAWIRYDRRLGPQLRRSEDMSVDFLGFDTRKPPFDDADVRRAFGMAVDWRSLARLADPEGEPLTSLLPPGIQGRDLDDHLPPHDPAGARALLAAAGYPEGAGFPDVALATYGIGTTDAIAADIERELGISLSVERRPFAELSALLDVDSPDMWTLSWSADYPHAHDFLGLLLRSDSSANTGGWSDAGFDQLIDAAASSDDPVEQEELYGRAQAIVRDQVPLVPLGYGDSWSLSRDGLGGAAISGTGLLRFADLEWRR